MTARPDIAQVLAWLEARNDPENGWSENYADAERVIREAQGDIEWLTRTVMESAEARENAGIGADASKIAARWRLPR